MKTESRELLIRTVGILEGLLLTTDGGASNALEIAVNNIEEVLKEERDG